MWLEVDIKTNLTSHFEFEGEMFHSGRDLSNLPLQAWWCPCTLYNVMYLVALEFNNWTYSQGNLQIERLKIHTGKRRTSHYLHSAAAVKLNSGWQRTNPLSPRIEDLNLPPPAYKSSALTTWLHCLLCIGTVLSIRFEEGGYLSKSPTREYHKITISLLLSITSVQNKLASNRVFSVKLCRWSLNIHILYKKLFN